MDKHLSQLAPQSTLWRCASTWLHLCISVPFAFRQTRSGLCLVNVGSLRLDIFSFLFIIFLICQLHSTAAWLANPPSSLLCTPARKHRVYKCGQCFSSKTIYNIWASKSHFYKISGRDLVKYQTILPSVAHTFPFLKTALTTQSTTLQNMLISLPSINSPPGLKTYGIFYFYF